MFRAYLFFGVIVMVRGQIPSIGVCPDYLPMADFDIDNFLGKWYEAERYFQFTDITSRCVVTDYAKGPSGKIYMSNEVTNRLTGIKRVIDGQVELTGRIGEGKLNVKYLTTPLSSTAQLTVLDTDYNNYAVIYSCSGFGLVYAQSAWVMTRERLPPGSVLQQIYGILDKFKISRSFFVKTDQEGCALAASDINAANGITAQSTVAVATGQPQRNVPNTQAVPENEAVKSVEGNLETIKYEENNPKIVEHNANVVNNFVEGNSHNAKLESASVVEIESHVQKTDLNNENPVNSDSAEFIATSVVTDSVSNNEVSSGLVNTQESQLKDNIKPVQVPELLLENNSSQQNDPSPEFPSSDIKPVEKDAEEPQVPGQVTEEKNTAENVKTIETVAAAETKPN